MIQLAPVPPAHPRTHPSVRELERLGDEIAVLAAHLHAATYRLLVLIAEFDRLFQQAGGGTGFRSAAHWLSWRTGLGPGAAREKVRVARALGELPKISEAMSRGRLSYSKVRALTRVARPEDEAELVEFALHATAAHVERVVRAWRRVDRLEGERRRHESRHLSVWPDEDGSYVVRGRLDPEVGALLVRALEATEDELYRRDRRRDEGQAIAGAQEPTPGQRRADALGLLVECALQGGLRGEGPGHASREPRKQTRLERAAADGELGTVRASADTRQHDEKVTGAEAAWDAARRRDQAVAREPGEASEHGRATRDADEEAGQDPPRDAADLTPLHRDPPSSSLPLSGIRAGRFQVVVHVDAEALREGSVTGQSVLEGGVGVPAETSRRLACDAARVVMTHAPDGSVLDVGRRTRTVPPAIRRVLEARDRGCRFPGCGLRFCEAHHVTHWADGGATRLENLVLLCRLHHRAVHEGGFRVTATGAGELRFQRPDGGAIPEVPPVPRVPDAPAGAGVGEPGPWDRDRSVDAHTPLAGRASGPGSGDPDAQEALGRAFPRERFDRGLGGAPRGVRSARGGRGLYDPREYRVCSHLDLRRGRRGSRVGQRRGASGVSH